MSNKIALDALTTAQRAINSMKAEAETAGAGSVNLMRGSVARHFATAIDAAIAARSKT